MTESTKANILKFWEESGLSAKALAEFYDLAEKEVQDIIEEKL